MSPPSRGRGSKRPARRPSAPRGRVAPFAGAWIETTRTRDARGQPMSRPLRGGVDRNLSSKARLDGQGGRLLRGGVDRNHQLAVQWRSRRLSPPSRGRGSKHSPWRCRPRRPGRLLRGGVDRNIRSRQTAERIRRRPLRGGVDRNTRKMRRQRSTVAPFAGAWIETHCCDDCFDEVSPPSRGRGSKRAARRRSAVLHASPPSRGRGSKLTSRQVGPKGEVASFAGAWIETRNASTGAGVARASPPSRGRGSKRPRDRRTRA